MQVNNLHSIYRGKKVFITGHTGFKGTWLLQWLYLLGAEIKGYALPPFYKDDLYNLLGGESLCDSVFADINNKEFLEESILSFAPDFIFHLAAQPLVKLSYETPSQTFSTNALGTAYLLDAIRKLNKPCSVVLITTDKVYENKEWIYPYRESDRLGGLDPYSASKACAELVIQSYVNSFFSLSLYNDHKKAIAIARAGNVIGGGDWAKDRIIPDIVKSLFNKKTVEVRNPHAVRPWQHVLEPLWGYLMLGAKLSSDPEKFSGAWNFGPLSADNNQVEELVKVAIKIWGSGSYEISALLNQPHEATLLRLDITKAINVLGWTPQYTSIIAIEKTIAWYKHFNEDKNGIKAFTINQIQAYTGLT